MQKQFLFFVLLIFFTAACTSAVTGDLPEAAPGNGNSQTTSLEETETEPMTSTPVLIEGENPPAGAASEFSTDFSIHSVSYAEIISGGPPKDGIPPIDNPVFTSISEAQAWLAPTEPVVVVDVDEIARAYPIQILTWHEIVNDEINGLPITTTFCPLCNSTLAFERELDGVVYDFGTSGRLRNSNLIMYDRQTESWWQQASGEAIVGSLTGKVLTRYPSAMTSFEAFWQRYPEGLVLSRETGFLRSYGQNPYTGYDTPGSEPFLYFGETSDALNAMERVLAVEVGSAAKAYPFSILWAEQVINDTLGGQEIAVFWQAGTNSALGASQIASGADVGAAAAYQRTLDGQTLTFAVKDGQIFDMETGSVWDIHGYATAGALAGERLTPVISANHFWFSWFGFRPDTAVYQLAPGSDMSTGGLALKHDFAIEVYQGFDGAQTVQASQLFDDNKPVVINFWAALCPICVIEMDELQTVYDTYQDSINLVAVDIGPFVRLGDKEDALALIEDKALTFPAGTTQDTEVMRQYTVLGTPTTVFFNADGSISEVYTGLLSLEQFNAKIAALK